MRRSARWTWAVVALAAAGCGSSGPKGAAPTSVVPTVPSTTRAVDGPASSGPPGRRFRVSPAQLAIGQPVTFSGTGCASTRVVVIGIDHGSETAGTSAATYPAADGSWRRTVTVGDSTLLGSRTAYARCEPRSQLRSLFTYEPVLVQIRTFRRMNVAPGTAVRAGTTLDVSSAGACAVPANAQAQVALQAPPGTATTFRTVYGTVTQDAQGNWSARVPVPANAAAGRLELTGTCAWSRSFTAWYPTVTITVLPRS